MPESPAWRIDSLGAVWSVVVMAEMETADIPRCKICIRLIKFRDPLRRVKIL